jgi:hypothetical protein
LAARPAAVVVVVAGSTVPPGVGVVIVGVVVVAVVVATTGVGTVIDDSGIACRGSRGTQPTRTVHSADPAVSAWSSPSSRLCLGLGHRSDE